MHQRFGSGGFPQLKPDDWGDDPKILNYLGALLCSFWLGDHVAEEDEWGMDPRFDAWNVVLGLHVVIPMIVNDGVERQKEPVIWYLVRSKMGIWEWGPVPLLTSFRTVTGLHSVQSQVPSLEGTPEEWEKYDETIKTLTDFSGLTLVNPDWDPYLKHFGVLESVFT